MPLQRKYLFRGTTIAYEGGTNSREHNFTCTTSHPVIGLLFAKECANRYPDQAVIYIARMDKVEHLIVEANVLKKMEQEYVVGVTPTEFYKYTEGYVRFRDLQKILKEIGMEVTEIVRKDKLSELCKSVKKVKVKEFETLISLVQNIIETN